MANFELGTQNFSVFDILSIDQNTRHLLTLLVNVKIFLHYFLNTHFLFSLTQRNLWNLIKITEISQL